MSAVISTRVKPGQQDAFLRWYRRISAVQARFEGFQGYKFEAPIPGVQDDWVTILRFDSDAHLEAWLNSEQRKQVFSTILLGWVVVPPLSKLFGWWLNPLESAVPAQITRQWVTWAGTALILCLYAVLLLVFSHLPS